MRVLNNHYASSEIYLRQNYIEEQVTFSSHLATKIKTTWSTIGSPPLASLRFSHCAFSYFGDKAERRCQAELFSLTCESFKKEKLPCYTPGGATHCIKAKQEPTKWNDLAKRLGRGDEIETGVHEGVNDRKYTLDVHSWKSQPFWIGKILQTIFKVMTEYLVLPFF